MASRFPLELELTVSAARDLKNVNWKYGDLHPYVVAWVDPDSKVTTRVSDDGDTDPVWNEKLTIPIRSRIEDAELSLDVVHANASGDTKPLVGSARLSLREVVDQVGYRERFMKTLKLKRPSGRPHGKIEIKAAIRENRYSAPDPYAQPYGTRNYSAPQPAGYGYGAAPQPAGYGYVAAAAPPSGYPPYGSGYGSGYGAPQYGSAPPAQYGSAAPPPVSQPYYGGGGGGYGGAPPATGPVVAEQPQKSKMGGMGAGLAVGAVAGVLGGLALAGGADYVGDKIAEKAAEKVEEDYSYGGGDGGGDYDDDY